MASTISSIEMVTAHPGWAAFRQFLGYIKFISLMYNMPVPVERKGLFRPTIPLECAMGGRINQVIRCIPHSIEPAHPTR
jgi:hypothetical protein